MDVQVAVGRGDCEGPALVVPFDLVKVLADRRLAIELYLEVHFEVDAGAVDHLHLHVATASDALRRASLPRPPTGCGECASGEFREAVLAG